MHQRHTDSIIGINWGSSNLRAYLIGTDGRRLDAYETPAGVRSGHGGPTPAMPMPPA